MTAWEIWAAGVLNGIGAPIDAANVDALWAWSNAESGADVMRWNNPLNTTLQWLSPPSHPMNSVGVQAYLDGASGIAATVATLLNGYYPVILDHLRRSVPRAQWADACPNLGTWGTGCGWLTYAYGAAPGQLGEEVLDPNDPTVKLILNEIDQAQNLLERGTDAFPGYAGTAHIPTSADLLTAIKAIPAGQAPDLSGVTALNAKVDALAAAILRIETALKGA